MNDNLKELFWKSLLAYIEVLEIHIDSKTTDKNLHEITSDMYRSLFEITHSIAERYVDLWGSLRSDHWNCKSQWSRLVDILTTLKSDIESITETTSWTKAMLDNSLNDLEFQIWNVKTIWNKWMNKSQDNSWIELWWDETKQIEVEIKTETKPTEDDTMSDEVEDIISL